MQIVINISKKLYDRYKEKDHIKRCDIDEFEKALDSCIILPKGHGRIKDIDKIEWYGCTTELDCPHKDRECKDCDRAECRKTQVDGIPTIIEADGARENEVS